MKSVPTTELRLQAVLWGAVGYIQQTKGDLGAAEISYRSSLVIAQKLAASDPSNSLWQRGL